MFHVFWFALAAAATAQTPEGAGTFDQSDEEAFATLVGRWRGCYVFEDIGAIDFVSNRFSDARYVLESRHREPKEREYDSVETGIWGVEEGYYYSVYEDELVEVSADSEPPAWRTSYKILSLTNNEFVYRSDMLNITFAARRVGEDYALPSQPAQDCTP